MNFLQQCKVAFIPSWEYKFNKYVLWAGYLARGLVLKQNRSADNTALHSLVKHLPNARHATESSSIHISFLGDPEAQSRESLPKCTLNHSQDGNMGEQGPKVLTLAVVAYHLHVTRA